MARYTLCTVRSANARLMTASASTVRAARSTPDVSLSSRWHSTTRSRGNCALKIDVSVFLWNFAVGCTGSPAGLSTASKAASWYTMGTSRGTSGSSHAGRYNTITSPGRTMRAGLSATPAAVKAYCCAILAARVRDKRGISTVRNLSKRIPARSRSTVITTGIASRGIDAGHVNEVESGVISRADHNIDSFVRRIAVSSPGTLNAAASSNPSRRSRPCYDRRAVTPLVAVVLLSPGLRDVSRTRVAQGRIPRGAEANAVVAAVGGPLQSARGRVETPEHAPIGGANVQAILVLNGRSFPLGEAITDDDGSFAMAELPEGTYWLVARAPGRARRIQTERVVRGPVSPWDVVLAPGVSIEGSVLLAAAHGAAVAPAQDILIRALPDGGGDEPPFGARSDASGRFTLAGLALGTYRVEVVDPRYEPVVRRAVPAPGRGLDLTLRALARITGIVVGENGSPHAGAQVTLGGSGVWPRAPQQCTPTAASRSSAFHRESTRCAPWTATSSRSPSHPWFWSPATCVTCGSR